MQRLKDLRHGVIAAVMAAAVGMTTDLKTARASGFPVIDVANFAQAIEDYILQNSQLAQQILMLAKLVDQYALTIENLKGYANADALRSRVEQILVQRVGDSLVSILDHANPLDESFEEQIAVVYETLWKIPRAVDSIDEALLTRFDDEDRERIKQGYAKDFNQYQAYSRTFQVVANSRHNAEARRARINEYGALLGGLGPNQEAKTQQLIAAQTHLLLQQIEALVEAQDHAMTRLEAAERESLSQRARVRDRELERIKRQTETRHSGHDFDSWLQG